LEAANPRRRGWSRARVWVVIFLGSYKAQLVLLNNTNTNAFGLDLLSWRILQKNLPNLANQLVKNDKLAQDKKAFYQAMSNSQ
jgi:hypothetical protein